jgi:hypothetical protein
VLHQFLRGSVLAFALAACGGDDPADPGDDNNNNGTPGAQVTGTIGGGSVGALISSGFTYTPDQPLAFVFTDNQSRTFTAAIANPTVGNNPIGPSRVGDFAAWTVGSQSWRADFLQGSGSISLDVLSTTRIAGEAILTLTPLAGSGATGVVQASFSFNFTK